ncbi:catabolic 3-dehydroquinase [Aspergillus heteromorphus CBS 117.55]|uniref:Catabolic 3-dehydroquinase n=1 Tax=Aspergillus heteromorphus CBS 117.55 TaxID=1448321 RepID=A0A317W5Y9_9EURO|nr:catabolic 3-dehydroquinase [Aspergillus heteromorphus CBS 117.55]PWY82014.1 catabolic 3-dehydroquinase [Aspergillus heteromorphus CBS 117.55]
MVYNITEKETQPTVWSHINGPESAMLDRYCVSELCKGWPVYRDASEWNHYRDLFVKDGAFVFTTWSGGLPIDDFISVSIKGRANGDHIMHRENGTLVDLNPSTGRAIGKMKATITQRFSWDGVEFDVDCDCRFINFCVKQNGEWKVVYIKLFYEKDRVAPADGHTVPTFDAAELERYPKGYQYLAVAQARLGHPILGDLPTMDNEAFFALYRAMDAWLEGRAVGDLLGIPRDAEPRY